MIPIQNLLNKIKWDPKEDVHDYSLFYYDRIDKSLHQIKFTDVKEMSENFVLVVIGGKEVDLPLHRIKKVVKKGKVVWER